MFCIVLSIGTCYFFALLAKILPKNAVFTVFSLSISLCDQFLRHILEIGYLDIRTALLKRQDRIKRHVAADPFRVCAVVLIDIELHQVPSSLHVVFTAEIR